MRAGAALLLLASLLPAQSTRPQDLAAGKLLVASRDLGDPNFAQTVVLLVHYDDHGVVGLVVNRRTKVPISRALEELKGAKGRADLIYSGGPVGRADVLALVRSQTKLDDAERVFGDVYLVTSAGLLEKTMAGNGADSLHVYVGYAGWTPRQLEGEVELGAWFIFSGDAGAVFAANPQSVWTRLIERTEDRVASLLSKLGRRPGNEVLLWGGPPGPRGYSRTRFIKFLLSLNRPTGRSAADLEVRPTKEIDHTVEDLAILHRWWGGRLVRGCLAVLCRD